MNSFIRFLFAILVTLSALSQAKLGRTLYTTSDRKIDEIYQEFFTKSSSEACWNSFKILNADIMGEGVIPANTLIYMPESDECYIKDQKETLAFNTVFEKEALKEDLTPKKESQSGYSLSIEVGNQLSTLDGTNSKNTTTLELLSKSHYYFKFMNRFKSPKWTYDINLIVESVEFKELESVKLVNPDNILSTIEINILKNINEEFRVGLYQKFGESILHGAVNSGVDLELFKYLRWSGSLGLEWQFITHEKFIGSIFGEVGYGISIADEKRDTHSGLTYLAKIEFETNSKGARYFINSFARGESSSHQEFEQELLNVGLGLGFKFSY